MGFQIEDGSGKGYQAKVNNESMISVYAVIDSKQSHTNIRHGTSYNLLFSQTGDSTASSCILYIKNEDIEPLIVKGIGANVASDEYIEVVLNDSGTPVGGSAIAPVNLNSGINNVAEGVFQSGSNITGLSGGSKAFKLFYVGGEPTKYFNFDQDIIVARNRTLTLYCVNGGILIEGFVSFFFHEEDSRN